MNLTSSKFQNISINEEKNDKKLPLISKEVENHESGSGNIKFASAQNFHKSQQNLPKGLTLEDYFNNNLQAKDNLHDNRVKKFSSIGLMNPQITEQSEVSFENSEKKYMDASFEINETDEDQYNNSDSNSETQNKTTNKNNKKKYADKDNVIEHKKDDLKDLKNKIKEKYNKKNSIKKPKTQKIEADAIKPLRDYEKKTSLKLVNRKEDLKLKSDEHNKHIQEKKNDINDNKDQRENRMKISSQQNKKTYNSQSPPHSIVLQKNPERRNFSKDAFAKYSQEENDLNKDYIVKEKFEKHIAYRNSYDPNKNQFLMTGNFGKKKEEDKISNYINNNNEFNKSSYNSKTRLTLNEFYKHQNKYQEYGNPIGPPTKLKSWNSINNDTEVEKKYCDKEKIKEKMKNNDINFISRYASKFKLNEEECKFFNIFCRLFFYFSR